MLKIDEMDKIILECKTVLTDRKFLEFAFLFKPV